MLTPNLKFVLAKRTSRRDLFFLMVSDKEWGREVVIFSECKRRVVIVVNTSSNINMKLAFASALMVGTAAAFSTPSFGARSSALKSTVKAETYTFEKSEEIFAEAKTVS